MGCDFFLLECKTSIVHECGAFLRANGEAGEAGEAGKPGTRVP